jgi:transposase
MFYDPRVDEQERPVLRREIRRAQVEPFFAKAAPTEVVRRQPIAA